MGHYSVKLVIFVLMVMLKLSHGTTCSWKDQTLACRIRSLDVKEEFSVEYRHKMSSTESLEIQCTAPAQSSLRSDHFGSLENLRHLKITGCKLSSIPPRTFVGLSNLETITIHTVQDDDIPTDDDAAGPIVDESSTSPQPVLDIDYEAFIGLVNLTKVDISRNGIVQVSHRLLCNLGHQVELNISHNSIENIEDLGFGVQDGGCDLRVERLDISYNKIKSLSEGALDKATQLKHVNAAHNQINALDHAAFSKLANLEYISLSDNKLTALPPGLFDHNPKIKHVDISENNIGTIHKKIFRNMTDVVYINLSRNHLDQNWLKDAFQSLIQLEFLDLSSNHISKIDKKIFRSLQSLKYLNLANNRLAELDPLCLASVRSLVSLQLNQNKLDSLSNSLFISTPRLERLNLSQNKLQSLNKDLFKNVTNLRNLDISKNQLTEVPRGLTSLQSLDISSNIIGVLRREDFENMDNLTHLSISGNEISRIEGNTFNGSANITHLDMSRNRLHTLEQSTFQPLAKLTHMWLSMNQLKDINGLLTNQNNIKYLNLSSNALQWFDYAFIPNSLQTLDLQDNNIEEVENYYTLKDGFDLQYLDASKNKIKKLGVFSLLNSLRVIVLSHNQISNIGHNTFFSKTNLTLVDLRANKISQLGFASLVISPEMKVKPHFYLSGNPFHCTCDVQWMVSQRSADRLPQLTDLSQIECLVNYNGNSTVLARMAEVKQHQFLCEYSSHCFSLCMCCDFYACDCRMQCPDGCSCYHDTTWSANIIQCSARQNQKVPPLIPMDATSVFLDGNDFKDLSGQIFLGRSRMKTLHLNRSRIVTISNNTFSDLHDLQLLDLSYNYIQNIQGNEFSNLVNLKYLYLQGNKLLSIADEAFRPLKSLAHLRLDDNLLTNFPIWELASNPYITALHIAHNLWTCDCDFVNKFRMFVDAHSDKVLDAGLLQCMNQDLPEKIHFQTDKTCVESNRSDTILGTTELLIIIIVCCLLILLIAICLVICKNQKRVKKMLMSNDGINKVTRKIFERRVESVCDIFISYSLDDEHIAMKIADRLSAYKVNLQYKDSAAAKSNAKSTLIILSKSYIAKESETISTLCQQLILNTRNVYNIVATEEIDPSVHANTELDHVLKLSRAILFWQDLKFWEKLLTLIPASIADKMVVSQTNYSGSGVYGETDLVNQQHEYNSTLTLSQSQIKLNTLTPKSRLKPSIFSAVESNSEFIYLTPKPKKARCQQDGVLHGDRFDTLHGRSNSEVYQQIIDSPELSGTYHQRSRSHHAPLPVGAGMQPSNAPSPLIGTYNPRHSALVQSPQSDHMAMEQSSSGGSNSGAASGSGGSAADSRQMYGSSSFIYKLINSAQQQPQHQQQDEGLLTTTSPLQHPDIYGGGNEYEHQRSRSLMQQQLDQQQQQMMMASTASRNPVIHQKSKSAIARQGNHILMDQNGIMGRGNSYGHLTLNRPNELTNGGHFLQQQQLVSRMPPGPGHVTLSRVNSNGQIPNNVRLSSPSHMTSPLQQQAQVNHYLSNNIINGGAGLNMNHSQGYLYTTSPGGEGMMSPLGGGGVNGSYNHMQDGGMSAAQHRKYPSNIADEETASSRHSSPSVIHQRSKSTPYQGFVV